MNAHLVQARLLALAIAIALASATDVQAAVSLSIESKSATAGQSVLIGFFAWSNSGDVLAGFNLPVDLGPGGQGFSADIAYSSMPIRNSAFEFTALNTAANPIVNVDGVINGDGDGLTLGANPTKLFDLELTISSTASQAMIPIVIVNPTSPVNLFSIAGPGLPQVGGLQGGVLTITSGLNADFDGNGSVDGQDFLAWQRGFGIQAGAQHSNGDANANGVVASDDLAAWRTQFGQHGLVPSVASVPEPGWMALAIGVALGWMVASRCAIRL